MRGGIKVAYAFGVIDGFGTTVCECCRRRSGVEKNIYFKKQYGCQRYQCMKR